MAREPAQVSELGAELRRLRVAAGLSTFGLGDLIHFSKGYISKVENGQKTPSSHFVRAADSALGADGRLVEMAEVRTGARSGAASPDSAVPDISQVVDGQAVEFGSPEWSPIGEAEARYLLKAFENVLASLRDVGQILDPATVVVMLKPHFVTLRGLAGRLTGPLVNDVLKLTAHFADFTGWMTQEAGDDVAALWWIDAGAALARRINDDNIVAHTYVRRANIALYQQDAYGTISFARQAQALNCTARVEGFAALREAQGHALGGDYDSYKACVDRAVLLTSSEKSGRSDGGLQLGPVRIVDPTALARGWSLHDLGRSREAIEILRPLLKATDKSSSRAWARTASRLALALASVREVGPACDLAREVLRLSVVARSATIRSDLRQLSRTLNRWSSDPVVREIMPQLSETLLPVSGNHVPQPFSFPGDEW